MKQTFLTLETYMNEGFFTNIYAGSISQITKIANKLNIKNYVIDEYGFLIVNGDVKLDKESFTKFPLKFKRIKGNFSCRQCKNLISLDGSPEFIEGDFIADGCISLKNLNGGPKIVFGNYSITDCEKVSSLDGIAEKIGISLYLENTLVKISEDDIRKITSIKHNIHL